MTTGKSFATLLVFSLLLPTSAGAVVLERIGDSGNQGNPATEISIAGTDTHHLMTASRDSAGHLMVIRWDVDLDGTVRLIGSTTSDEIVTATAIDADFLPNSGATPYWANVVRSNGQMKLILWKLSGNGPVRIAEDTGGTITGCDVATSHGLPLGADHHTALVVLCQYASNAVDITSYVVYSNGALQFAGSKALPGGSSLGALTKISYVGSDINGTPLFLAAYRNASGNLRAALYNVNQFGTISETDAHDEGAIEGLAVAGDGIGNAVTAVRTNSGELKTIYWSTTLANALVRGQSASDGRPSGIAVGFLYSGLFATAARDENGGLDVDIWMQGAHLIDGNAGHIQSGRVAMQTLFTGAEGRAFTAVPDSAGNLKLIAWKIGEPSL